MKKNYYKFTFNNWLREGKYVKYELNQEFCLKEFNTDRVDSPFYKGERLNVDKIYVDINEQGRKTDFIYVIYCNGFNVSARLKKLLDKFNMPKAQYIPIYLTGTDKLIGYHVNLLEYFGIECMNFEKSRVNDHNEVIFPFLKYDVIKDKDLFSYRLKEDDLVWHLYVSSKLAKAIKRRFFRGIFFKEMKME